jgi:hypothetical protein
VAEVHIGRLHVWLGTVFFADGSDFYDTFVLTTPQGAARLQIPAEAESYFFRGYTGPHVIDASIGRIGVGIRAEKLFLLRSDRDAQAIARPPPDAPLVADMSGSRSAIAARNISSVRQSAVPQGRKK